MSENWDAEIDAMRQPAHHRAAVFTAEADYKLLRARTGPNPVRWDDITEYFAARGWPHSGDTLRRRLRELQAAE